MEPETSAPIAPAAAPEAPQAAAAPVEAPAATAPAAESAAPAPKTGFLARLVGADGVIQDLQSKLTAETAAHTATKADLATAHSRIAEYEKLENQLEEQVNAAKKNNEAVVNQKVAGHLQALGIPEEKAPSQTAADQGGAQVKTRKEWEALNTSQRAEFFKNGGKLID